MDRSNLLQAAVFLLCLLLLQAPSTAYFSSEWSSSGVSSMDGDVGFGASAGVGETCGAMAEECSAEAGSHVRMLYGRYYISYGALVADRVPCPPMSGRSYYTRNCYGARGPARPYSRGCSIITRCRRDFG